MEFTKTNKWAVPFYLSTAYVAVAILRPHEYTESLFVGVPLLPGLMVSAFLTWLLIGRKEFEAPQIYLAPILLSVMCLSMITSGWAGGAPEVLRDYFSTVGVFLLITCSVDTYQRLRLLVFLIVIMVAVIALHGVYQAENGIGWSGAIPIAGRITYVGVFNDPNDLGLIFVSTLPLVFYLLSEYHSLFWRCIFLASFLTILYAIYLTNSRGTVLGMLVTGGLYFLSRYGKLRTFLLGLVLVPMLLVLAPSRFQEIGDEDQLDESAADRFEAWYAGLEMFKEAPFFGIGATRFTEHHFLTAHNSFLIVLAELGFVGSYIWTAFVGLSLYMMYKLHKFQPAGGIPSVPGDLAIFKSYSKLSAALMYSLLAYLVAATFLSRSYAINLFIWCGLAVAHYQNFRQQWPESEPIRFRGNATKIFWFWFFTISGSYVLMKIGLAMM